MRWWLTAIALCFLLTFLQNAAAPDVQSPRSTAVPFRLARSLGLVLTGYLGNSPGIAGLAGEILFTLGVGLRTSLGSKTSGKALAIALLIWFGSGVVFRVVFSILFAIAALAFLALGSHYMPTWLEPLLQPVLSHLRWIAPLMLGLFWAAIGIWLIRRSVIHFDDYASRIKGFS